MRKLSIDFCRQIAEKHGGKCLSNSYSGSNHKLSWSCEKGHIWSTSLSSIYNNNSWCRKCSDDKRLKYGKKKKLDGIKIAQEQAALRNGKCLSTIYENSTLQKLLWECENGHQWSASLNNVKDNNHWCLECSGSKKLNIEVARDIAKKHGGKCLSDTYISTSSELTWQCDKGHVWKADLKRVKNRGDWCKQCYKASITIERLKEIAAKKNGVCLSNVYVPYKELLWRCEYGHEWKAPARNITRKNKPAWCPHCGRLKAARKSRHSYILKHWKTNEDLVCVGSYEVKTVEFLNKNRIEFLWQPKRFIMSEKKSYRPDAFFIDENMWIEIKGYFRQHSKDKWEWFHKMYPNSELWDKKRLEEKGILLKRSKI